MASPGLEATLVETYLIEPVVNFNFMRKALTDNIEYCTYVNSEETRCDNATLVNPCTDGERLCFSPVDKDSWLRLVVVKSQNWDEVGRATTFA